MTAVTEQCWALTGGFDEEQELWRLRLSRHVSGEPSSVEADWQWALDREETVGDVAGFAHTHPTGAGTAPSARDIRTMQAWCSALGKALLCLIGEGEDLDEASAYLFEDDRSSGRPTEAFELAEC